jgi:hypothetical protein
MSMCFGVRPGILVPPSPTTYHQQRRSLVAQPTRTVSATAHPPDHIDPSPPPSHPQTVANCSAPSTDRRALLTGLCVGSMHALAARGVTPATVLAAPSPIGSSTSTAALQRQLEQRVHEFTLSNGMRFLVSQRPNTAPIVSCSTYADVGAFDEVDGRTGIHSFKRSVSAQFSACALVAFPSLVTPLFT